MIIKLSSGLYSRQALLFVLALEFALIGGCASLGTATPDERSMRAVISTPHAPAAKGSYSQAIGYGDLLFISGQVPLDPRTGQWIVGDIEVQTRAVMEHIKAILSANGMTMNNVLSTNVYLKDFADFAKMNAVYAGYFKEVAPPARATVPAPLAGTMLIEISAVAGR